METAVIGSPSFAYIQVDLDPGESITAEADAMSSMAAGLDMTARFNGGFLPALLKRYLGGESLFINTFSNNTPDRQRLTLVQRTPGDVRRVDLNGDRLCLQPGAYICSSPGIKIGIRWAGLGSFIGREGLFKLMVSGTGTLWYGAYGGLVDRVVEGEYIVDSSHLVAYDPQLTLKVQLAGGLFASFFGGEGLVTRVVGTGRIVMQTRSLSGLVGWLNPKI